jgi:hypothetical protein
MLRLATWPIQPLATLIALLSLVACSRSPGGDDYFPLASGHRWTYTETTERDSGRSSQRSLSLETLPTDSLADGAAWHRRSDDGMHYWLRSDASGLFRVASRFELEEHYTPDKAPRYVLKQPFKAGTTWQADTAPYLLERYQEFPREIRHSHPVVPMSYRIEADNESVKTAAGSFEHCLLVQGESRLKLYVDAIAGWKDLPLVTREWYCPGVGLVKLTRDEHTQSQFLSGGTLTLELQEWN